MLPKGPDDEDVFLRKDGDIAYRLCRCHNCQVVRRCTPISDFYAFAVDPEKWLYCESCFMKEMNVDEMKIVDSEDVVFEQEEQDPAD
jgi:hypothetical protein